jgi:hypothetical protein
MGKTSLRNTLKFKIEDRRRGVMLWRIARRQQALDKLCAETAQLSVVRPYAFDGRLFK